MTGDRFDIDRVRLKNYRSIAACQVELGDLTLVVGPNGAGKSNFVDSLRFVAQSLSEGLDHALRERGGINEVRRRSTGHPHHFEIELSCRTSRISATYAFKVGSLAGGKYAVTREHARVAPHDPELPEHHFDVRDGEVVSTDLPHLPRVLPDRLTLVALSGHETFRPLVDGLTGVNVYNFNPERMREPQKPDPGELLRRDGSNVAAVVEVARAEFPREMEMVEEYLGLIVPGVSDVQRRDIGGWDTLTVKQAVGGALAPWTFPGTSMSDGTLRALGVLVALFASDPGSPSPVAIEEPETALHPAAAGYLLEALVSAARHRQVLVTSHSPDLLDSPIIGPEQLLAVRSEGGKTVVERVDPAGRRALAEGLFTAGELMRADQLVPESPTATTQTALW